MHVKLSDIGDIILGHTFRGAIVDDPRGNYAVLQAKNIHRDGTVKTEELAMVPLERMKMRALLRDQDVALSNRGTFRAGVFSGQRQNIIAASSLYIIRIHDHGRCLPKYLTIFLSSQTGQVLLEGMNRGTLIKSLPKRSLMELPIPIPALSVQHAVIDIHHNHSTRSELYERKMHLEEHIANQAISILISQ